jgi:superfamily II DNA/RNA helicase
VAADQYAYQRDRIDDLYITLVGELFDYLRNPHVERDDWARLAGALWQYAAPERTAEVRQVGINQNEALLYSAAAYYFGGFPASATLVIQKLNISTDDLIRRACYDLLAKGRSVKSAIIKSLVFAMLQRDPEMLGDIREEIDLQVKVARAAGPDEWIPLRLLQGLLQEFAVTNLISVLPERTDTFWHELLVSFVKRGTWTLFPSQIEAIQKGLLSSNESFGLQMPTGAGKTALCEILLFSHLKTHPEHAAVMLVPYRSLAFELRGTLVSQLNEMGLFARSVYGGTVPSGAEVRGIEHLRVLVSTPESLSGILGSHPEFSDRISLVICDEGHLLDAPSRGVGLELLLARLKVRASGSPRFVFMSAIVPNIDEVNSWLGGSEGSIVKSDYRSAIADFAVLRASVGTRFPEWDLEMHAELAEPIRYRITGFLRRTDLQWQNTATGRTNTYPTTSHKARAVAAARKLLPLGAVVIFAANKRGNEGAIGLAEELVQQLGFPFNLPTPSSVMWVHEVRRAIEFLQLEYGARWIGTRALSSGAVLHHGDIPQRTREVLESMLRKGAVGMAICTNTLAEGVNLPIRSLVLYSVKRIGHQGDRTALLMRDIKNLVGRVGRAGSNTRGLVLCANSDQWPLLEPVALRQQGEPIKGALQKLLFRLRISVALGHQLTNEFIEAQQDSHSLIDGIDSTLVDLMAEEVGADELERLALEIADKTFAARQTSEPFRQTLRNVVSLRAQRISAMAKAGRLPWIRETGTWPRMVAAVETGLLPLRENWSNIETPLDFDLLQPLFDWAWQDPDLQAAVRIAYQLKPNASTDRVVQSVFNVATWWLSGWSFADMSVAANLGVDDLLGVHSHVISYQMQTLMEQGILLLEKLVRTQGREFSPIVKSFPEHLRYGAPTRPGCILATAGVRHRRAYVALGRALIETGTQFESTDEMFVAAIQLLESNENSWQTYLGSLVLRDTFMDLKRSVDND